MRTTTLSAGLHSAALVLTLALAGTRAHAQCSDPRTPRFGFSTTLVTNQLVTFSDGYKTRADAVYPTSTPGSCGWPLVVSVHGFPGSKSQNAVQNSDLARQGFFVVSYDVRGQGSAIALNTTFAGRGSKMYSLDEWIDMFEIMEWAAVRYSGLVDPNRIGVYGTSQGGMHSWAAAAFSGRVPPTNKRRTKRFPLVRAAVPRHFIPHLHESNFPDGTMFKAPWSKWAYGANTASLVINASVKAIWARFLTNDDPMGMYQWLRKDPGRDFRQELTSTATAVLAIIQPADFHQGANRALATLAAMPGATPKRIFLMTAGVHGTPPNTYQIQTALSMKRTWFRRFLKGDSEPIEQGPPVLTAATPADRSTYYNRASLWRFRADAYLPPRGARTSTLYLRAGGQLSATAPGSEQPDVIKHRVAAGFNARTWYQLNNGRPIGQILTRIPLSNAPYRSAAYKEDTEIAGAPILRLSVTPNNRHFQVSARLVALSPSNAQLDLATGGVGVRQQTGPNAVKLRIEMGVVDTIIPKGYRLFLVVRNHFFVDDSNAVSQFRFMPFWNNYDLAIEHKTGATSELILPLRPRVRPDLSTSTTAVSIGSAKASFQVRSSASHRGGTYGLLCSLTGQGPAVMLPGGEALHLRWDIVTEFLLGSANTPLLPGFVGLLDAQGSANASMDLTPLAPAMGQLYGTALHIAPVVLASGAFETGAPLFLRFR